MTANDEPNWEGYMDRQVFASRRGIHKCLTRNNSTISVQNPSDFSVIDHGCVADLICVACSDYKSLVNPDKSLVSPGKSLVY